MKLLLSALGFVALFIFMLCLEIPPHREYEIPSVRARVVDAATGTPIPGARVTVTGLPDGRLNRTVSDAQGRFVVDPVSYIHWIRMPLGDRVGPWARIDIDATGYVSYSDDHGTDRPIVLDFRLAREVASE